MTVATEACYTERQYTGIETIFSPGYSALDAAHVKMGYFDEVAGTSIELTQGVHFLAALDPDTLAVTVTRIAFPSASPLMPVTLWFFRETPATQGVDFINLARFDPKVHENLADAAHRSPITLRAS